MAIASSEGITHEELQLAARNHGMPLEALAYDVTPVGLHYLLIHFDIPVVSERDWRLTVGGRVDQELSLSLDDVRSRPAVTRPVTMECAGNGRARLLPRPMSQPWLLEAVGNAEWTGTPLAPLLDEAGLAGDAVEIVFRGLDRGVEAGLSLAYERSLSVADARRDEVLLAYEVNGQPLPPQHGYPLRLVVPGWYGMTSVKWLTTVTAVDTPFTGFYQATSYRYRQEADEPGDPVTRIAVRSMMVPPGVPDFYSRRRFVEPGPCEVQGRAWSGCAPIAAVEVSADCGATWVPATLDPSAGPNAWHRWTWTWEPRQPGEYELWCRATDEAGNVQPVEPVWNLGGYAVNAVQRVPVTVGP